MLEVQPIKTEPIQVLFSDRMRLHLSLCLAALLSDVNYNIEYCTECTAFKL